MNLYMERNNMIKIKPSHKGLLHKAMGIAKGKKIPVKNIKSKLTKDKAKGNTKAIKQDVFAINAKTKFNKGK